MLTTDQLLDAAKQAQGIRSEYRLARLLNIGDNALYNYRHGRTPDDERALKLARLAGLNVPYVLTCMAAERAKDEEVKAALMEAARELSRLIGTRPNGGDSGGSGGGGGGILSGPTSGTPSAQNPDGMGLLGRLTSAANGSHLIHRDKCVTPDAFTTAATVAALPVVAIVDRRRRLSRRAA